MSWLYAAGLGSRRIAVALAGLVAVLGGGLILGPDFPAEATVVGGGVSVADASAEEGDGSGGQITFAVTTTGIVFAPETVTYRTVDGTAKAGEDYTATSGTLQITESGTQNVVVPLLGDTVVEPNETFQLQLSGGSSNDDTATGTITNDDFTVNIADLTITEGNSGTTNAPVVISLAGGTRNAPTTVQYSTVNGSAVAPNDYAAVNSATATIPAGQPSVTVNIAVVGDALFEDDESFRVVLANASSGVVIGDGDATVRILNNDPLPDPSQQPKVSIADKTFPEGDGASSSGVFDLTLSAPVPYSVSVRASSGNGSATAGTDYEPIANATVSFSPGQVTAQLPVTIMGDALDEFDETFTVTLSNPSPGAQLDKAAATGTITDDDPTPTLSVDPAAGNEGGEVTFTLRLSKASGRDTVVALATANQTATAGADYTAVPDTTRITIPAGATSATFDVDALTDALDEPAETFTLGARPATNPEATEFGPAVNATGTINDIDNAPALSIGDFAKAEGNTGTTPFVFTVTLAPLSAQPVTVNYAVGPDSGARAAVPAIDFTAANGQLTFAAGETTKTITVAVIGDTLSEDNETFRVTLSGAQNAVVSDGVGIGTIVNDDGSFVRPGALTTGAGRGGGAHVRFFEDDGTPVGPGFFGTVDGPGVRVARGDLDGDGHDEVIVSSGRGGPSLVRVFTPDGSGLVAQIDAYPGFTGGVSVAAADLDGDGDDEVITGAGQGGSPHVRTFSLTGEAGNRQLVGTPGFYGLDTSRGFAGGINVAAADTDANGKAEIIVSVISDAAPLVAVWKYAPATNQANLVTTFLAFSEAFRGGVNIAAGDLDRDGRAEIVVGAGPGGAPHVRVLSASGGGLPGSAYAYGASFPGGVQVAVGDIDGDGENEIVTGVGAGGGPHVRAFDIDMKPRPTSFYAYDGNFAGGVNVAVGNP